MRWRDRKLRKKEDVTIMSETNTPIQIPSELNVPVPTIDYETIESIKPNSAIKSADNVQISKKPRLQLDAKSQSMFNFPITSSANDGHTESKEKTNEEATPEITMSPPSTAAYRIRSGQKSAASFDHIDNLTPHTSDMELDENRKRVNSIAGSSRSRADGEFDELQAVTNSNSKLRIRSSIVSLFGRMGQKRRSSNISQNSTNDGAASKPRGPPIRALPQIAATKILRAFSYVGKPDHALIA